MTLIHSFIIPSTERVCSLYTAYFYSLVYICNQNFNLYFYCYICVTKNSSDRRWQNCTAR